MNHPELLLIPAMMLLDYFLTVWGKVLREQKYRHHFRIEHYELNPIWQKSVAQQLWFNPRHLALVAAMTALCLWWSSSWNFLDNTLEDKLGFITRNTPALDPFGDTLMKGVFGCLTITFACIIGNHVSNIFTFRYLLRHPESISGEVTMSHALVLSMSRFRFCVLFFPLLLIAIFSPSPFVIGGLYSPIVLFIVHMVWAKKAKARSRKENPA